MKRGSALQMEYEMRLEAEKRATRAEAERDALARRVAELEAALKEERGKAMSLWSRLGAVSGDLLAHADRLNDALASTDTGETP